jgi:hypothetical protein
MREKKLVETLQVVDKICDNCGCSTQFESEGLSIDYTFGYTSEFDMESISIDICDKCIPIVLGKTLMQKGFENAKN